MYSEGLTPDFLTAYIVWLIISFIPVLLSAVIITFVEPKAAGSGILEVKCYLNGIVMPKLLGLRCLLVKMTSCILCHVGGLPGGKVGFAMLFLTINNDKIIDYPASLFYFVDCL